MTFSNAGRRYLYFRVLDVAHYLQVLLYPQIKLYNQSPKTSDRSKIYVIVNKITVVFTNFGWLFVHTRGFSGGNLSGVNFCDTIRLTVYQNDAIIV